MEKIKNQNSQSNPLQFRTSGIITIPDFKVYYRAIALKTAQYWHKNKEEDQCKQTENLDIKAHAYETNNIKWKKKAYSANGAAITGYQHVE